MTKHNSLDNPNNLRSQVFEADSEIDLTVSLHSSNPSILKPQSNGSSIEGGLDSSRPPSSLLLFNYLVNFANNSINQLKGLRMKKYMILLSLILASTVAFAQDGETTAGPEVYSENPDQTVRDDESKDKSFSVTPSVNILHFPHPVEGAVELVFSKAFSLKYSKSFKPDFKVDGNEAEMDNESFGIRTYPGQGAFFIGVAYGKHEVDATRNETINGFDTNIYARAKSEYVTPSVGWKWVYDSGFTVGMELGWLFPFNGSARVASNQDLNPLVAGDAEFQNKRADVEDAAEKYVDHGLPSIGLLEIGWTF